MSYAMRADGDDGTITKPHNGDDGGWMDANKNKK
jgi:hypothetical protein